jgi:mevalonate kinase
LSETPAENLTRSAPAKIILFGEHAVVHGQPAIAIPFTALKATAEATPGAPGSGLIIHANDLGSVWRVEPSIQRPDNALLFAAQLTLEKLNVPPPDLNIAINSTIPIASGLGSGTAVTTALIRVLSAALNAPLDSDELNSLVYKVEELHHGTPSGIDNTVIVKGAPVYFVRSQPSETFNIGQPFTLVVADSGISASTRETVGLVGRLYDADPPRYGAIFKWIGAMVREARGAIEKGDLQAIGDVMNRNHELLDMLTVSSPPLEALTQAARAAGSHGAKLSGGGRGGNVIALVDPEIADTVSQAMRKAGAVRSWVTTVGDAS